MLKKAFFKEEFFSMHYSYACTQRTSPSFFLHFPALVLLILLIFSNCAFGQAGDAWTSGLVSDPAGRMVEHAEVTIKNMTTNVVTVTVTNEAGVYTFPGLLPGDYVLTVQKQGFQSVDLVDLTLHTQERLERDFIIGAEPDVERSEAPAGSAKQKMPVLSPVLLTDPWEIAIYFAWKLSHGLIVVFFIYMFTIRTFRHIGPIIWNSKRSLRHRKNLNRPYPATIRSPKPFPQNPQ